MSKRCQKKKKNKLKKLEKHKLKETYTLSSYKRPHNIALETDSIISIYPWYAISLIIQY